MHAQVAVGTSATTQQIASRPAMTRTLEKVLPSFMIQRPTSNTNFTGSRKMLRERGTGPIKTAPPKTGENEEKRDNSFFVTDNPEPSAECAGEHKWRNGVCAHCGTAQPDARCPATERQAHEWKEGTCIHCLTQATEGTWDDAETPESCPATMGSAHHWNDGSCMQCGERYAEDEGEGGMVQPDTDAMLEELYVSPCSLFFLFCC